MIIKVYLNGRRYVVKAPRGSQVVPADGEDYLVYPHRGRTERLPTPVVVMLAHKREKGLRLVSETFVT